MAIHNRGSRSRLRSSTILGTAALLAAWPAGAVAADKAAASPRDDDRLAQAAGTLPFNIPAQPLNRALTDFGAQAGLQVTFDPAIAAGLRSGAVAGRLTPAAALERLLAGTGIAYRLEDGTVTLARNADEGGVRTLNPITVEGQALQSRFGDAPPEPGRLKAEYQVSATKTPLPLKQTPQTISVVTRESIDRRLARDVTSALELSAGLANARAADGGPFAGRGLGGGAGFSLRGQQLDTKRDVRIDSFAQGANEFDLAPFERVEVIKGPSSALYGQGSLGGFINMVRKKPQDTFAASVTGLAGSFNTRRGEADVTGPLTADGRVRGRAIAAWDDSGAFIDGVETRTAVFAPSLEAQVGERTRVLLELLAQDDKYTPSRGLPLRLEGDELKIPEISRSQFNGVPSQQKSEAQNLLASLRLDHELSDRWLATLLLQGGGQDRERFFDSYANAGYLDRSGSIYIFSDRSTLEDRNYAGELRLDGRFDLFGRDHGVLVGLEHNRRRTDLAFGYTYLGMGNLYSGDFAAGNILPGGAGNQAFDFDISTVSRNTAPYLQLTLNVTERARLLVGARYDFSDIERDNNISGAHDETSDEEFTGRIGLSYDLTPNITAYAVYARSFEPSVDARSVSGDILDPVTGEGYEAGLKTEWFDGGLGATVAVFEQELDKVPITDPNNRNFSISGGLQRTRGIELEVIGTPLPGLEVGISASQIDSEFIDVRDDNFGLSPNGVEQQATVFGRYVIQEGTLSGLGFGATLVHVGEQVTLQAPQNNHLEGYERVDFSLSYTGFDGFDLSLHVRNVFDERYIERLRDRFQDNFFGAPRAFLVRAEARF